MFGWRSSKPVAPPDERPVINRDASVGYVEPDEFVEHAGTPGDPGISWQGILLNAPRCLRITARRADPLFGGDTGPCAVIWGNCMLPCRIVDQGIDHRERLTLVAVDVANKQVFRGRVQPRPSFGSIHVERPLPIEAPMPGLSAGGAFNPDLIRICGIPVRDADYEIFALVDEWRSNVIDVQVRVPVGG